MLDRDYRLVVARLGVRPAEDERAGSCKWQRDQLLDGSAEHRAFRQPPQSRVKRLVDFRIAAEALPGHREELFRLPAVQPQRAKLVGRFEALGGEAGGSSFQHAADLDRVPDVVQRERPNPESRSRERFQQPFLRQPFERHPQLGTGGFDGREERQLG